MSTKQGENSYRADLERLQAVLVSQHDALTKDEALDLATEAAGLMLRCLKLARDGPQKDEMKSKCKSLLDKAEQIKTSNEWKPSDEGLLLDLTSLDEPKDLPVKTLPAPVSTRPLTTKDKILLMKGSRVNGFTFLPWEGPPGIGEFLLDENQQRFSDVRELSLSDEQKEMFDSWKRPGDALPPQTWLVKHTRGDINFPSGPHMRKLQKVDLVQDAATDCSVVASLCAGIARTDRGHASLLSTVFYPHDPSSGCPKLSPNGKYIIKLNFNGTSRQVIIDDRLPTTKSSRLLHVIDRNNPGLLWPALVEKAYLKVRGGYDFPGSNSGTDLWMLSGWIPEQIFLQRPETDRDALWTRVKRAFEFGDAMVTIGTGDLTVEVEKELGLAGRHDYAVLDMKLIDGRREMLIKNPWSNGLEWRDYPSDSSTNTYKNKNSALNRSIEGLSILDSTSSKNSNDELSPGTFWMTFHEVMQNFESLYVNWNPGLFKYRQDVHFDWDFSSESSIGRGGVGCFATNPQHCITSAKDDKVWLLLSRHFKDQVPTFDMNPAYISLYAFDSHGERVSLRKGALVQVPYVDSPQVLLSLDVVAKKPYTIVTSEQDLPASLHTFTLSAFSNSSLSFEVASPRFKYRQFKEGCWTRETAGGNVSSLTYSENPQYCCSISQETRISLLLQTRDPELRIHIKLVHGRGKRVYSLAKRDIIIDSGDYRSGWALAETATPVMPGNYTIICSTFDTGQTGNFSIIMDTNCSATLNSIPSEDAGRRRTALAIASFRLGAKVLAAPLKPRRITPVFLTAKYVQKASSSSQPGQSPGSLAPSPIRMTIELGRGPDSKILIASGSGEFSDNPIGIRTEDVTLNPEVLRDHTMWLVLERMGGGSALGNIEEKIQVEMLWYGLEPIEVGVWREWQ